MADRVWTGQSGRMWLALALAPALAGTLTLPPDEDRGDWSDAFALAGLDGQGEHVALTHDRSGWWLLPPHSTGRIPVPAPNDPEAREAIAVLAASLLRRVDPSVALPALPPLLAPPPRSKKLPESQPTEPTGASTLAAPFAIPEELLLEPMVPEVLDGLVVFVDPESRPPPPPWVGWWDVGAGAAWRNGVKVGPAAQFGAGAAKGPARIGGRVDFVERFEIPDVGGFSSTNLLFGAWLAPPDSANAGLVGGVSIRRSTEAGPARFVQAMAIVGVEAGGRIVTPSLELLPRIRLTADLAATALVRDGADVGTLAPAQIGAEVGFRPKIRRRTAETGIHSVSSAHYSE